MATEFLNFIQRQAMLAGGQYGRGIPLLEVTLNLVPDQDNQIPGEARRKRKTETALDRALALLSGEDE